LGLETLRAGTQGSSSPHNPGLEDAIPLGLQKGEFSRDPLELFLRTQFPKGIIASLRSGPALPLHHCPTQKLLLESLRHLPVARI